MQEDKGVDVQAFLILLLLSFLAHLLNIVFNFTTSLTEYLLLFIAWRVIAIELDLYKN